MVASRRRCSLLAAVLLLSLQGCTDGPHSPATRRDDGRAYPAPPQAARVLALGNLRGGNAPSESRTNLSMFLFGTEPQAPLSLIRPAQLAMRGETLLISDMAYDAVFAWDAAAKTLREVALEPRPGQPIGLTTTASGDLVVVDARERIVLRYGADGRMATRYAPPSGEFRPAAALEVNGELWVTNVAEHRIEVFDLESGRYVKAIGGRGEGTGQFGVPLGMARTPEGEICVVDMLNYRVQVLSAAGEWIRNIGQGGDRPGTFGRPKDIAVGPDGTVFVADAASQRVHAFDGRGRALLAFGHEGSLALSVPGGLRVVVNPPMDVAKLPANFQPTYYLLAVEQVNEPGVRVFAWGQDTSAEAALAHPVPGFPPGGRPLERINAAGTLNPHWSAEHCGSCHRMEGGVALAIAPADVDPLCLSCHDGKRAFREPHPVGRLAAGPGLTTPEGWPLADGRLTCRTCHNIQAHCSPTAQRSNESFALLRDYDEQRPLDQCKSCHVAGEPRRMNPHVQLVEGVVQARSCLFCHTSAPTTPADGAPSGQPLLRREGSALCLSCHARHWDWRPGGHVNLPATPAVRAHMLAVEERVFGRSAGKGEPAWLRLNNGSVTCYSCHNPHQAGLMPANSPLGRYATEALSSELHLRTDYATLCLACHSK